MKCCHSCKYASVLKEGTRTIIQGNITIVQTGKNSITCMCPNEIVKNISINGDVMTCSAYAEHSKQ